MKSIYQQALGAEFSRLHPRIQERFGFSSRDGLALIGKGVMSEVWHGPVYTLPFLYCGTWRNIMFPERGRDIPFRIENYAYRDRLGRETVTWVRTFETRLPRRFDAYMIYSEERRSIVDYLGTHQHLAVDLDLAVDPQTRGLRLRSGPLRFYEGRFGFTCPSMVSGDADVYEWFDDDAGCFRIDVTVHNRVWGKLFGYRGAFQVEERRVSESDVPARLLPKRVEARH